MWAKRLSSASFAWLVTVVVVGSGCYLSREPRDGFSVEVLTSQRRGFSAIETYRPASGARVLARRCSDGAVREARVSSDGLAFLPFDAGRCFDVTAVSPDRRHAISVMRSTGRFREPIVFVERIEGREPVAERLDLRGEIVGRAETASLVTVLCQPLFIASDGISSSPWNTTSADRFTSVHSNGPLPTHLRFFAIEWDEDDRPVNALETSVDLPEDRRVDVTLRFPSPPVAIRTWSTTLALPTTGPATWGRERLTGSFQQLEEPDGSAWINGRSEAVFESMTARESLWTITTRSPAVNWPSNATERRSVLIHRDDDVLKSIVGVVDVPSSASFVRVPPLDEAALDFDSVASLGIRVGGSGHLPYVAIDVDRVASSFVASTWQIYGAPSEVLALDALPPLPDGLAPSDLGIDATHDVFVRVAVLAEAAHAQWGDPGLGDSSGWNLEIERGVVRGGP